MVDLRFVTPELRRLDETSAEVIIAAVFEDERPFGGVAGLIDWRLGTRLSRLARDGFLTGKMGEAFAMPSRPRLPFDKLVLVGAGKASEFNATAFQKVLSHMLRTLEGLAAKTAVLELPGRGHDRVDPTSATDMFLEVALGLPDPHAHDTLFLVEAAETRKLVETRMAKLRRSVRRGGQS